ncbi:AmmeMemoRadiSam system radical SAM enzyme [Thermodesulfobacteriota bacterium]
MRPLDSVSRREFLSRFFSTLSRAGLVLGGAGVVLSAPGYLKKFGEKAFAADLSHPAAGDFVQNAPIARYWVSTASPNVQCLACHSSTDNLEDKNFEHGDVIIKCELCAQECIIREGQRGICRARMNVKGELRSLVYGHPISVHVDPIEKKPFYHFHPGSAAFSLATAGCPLSCKFCQNWQISQARPEDFQVDYFSPEVIVAAVSRRQAPIIAYTYNEPTVFTEYLTDIARVGRKQNLMSVLISCGFMKPSPLAEMCEVLDAIKIDLKGFSKDFYRRVCGADLEPVLRSIKQVAKSGVHLEIVNLVVPTLNDSTKMLNDLTDWVVGEVGPDVPVHFTRFHPDYQMLHLPPTPIATLEKAYEIAKLKGMHYPFVGNVPGHAGNHTYCPACGKAVIRRTGFFITAKNLKQGRCNFCNEPIAGVWA